MRKRLALLGAVTILGLTGCGEPTASIDDYGKVDATEQVAKEDTKKSDKDKEDADKKEDSTQEVKLNSDGIPEHLTTVINENEVNNLNVDADICSLGYKTAKTYKIEKIEKDDAFFINMATQLFDDGKYTVVLPYKYWTDAELDAEDARLQQLQQEADDEGMGREINHHFLEDLKKASLGGKAAAKPAFIGEDNILCEDTADKMCPFLYDKDRFTKLRGTIDGKEYELTYNACIGIKSGDLSKLNLRALFPISVEDDNDGSSLGENPVKQSDVENEAEKILKKLGYDDFILGASQNRVCKNRKTQDIYYDGMDLHYIRSIGELSNNLVEYVDIIDYENMENNTFTEIPQEFVDFTYGEDGLLGIEFSVHYKIGDALSEDVNMLSFDQVIDVVENYLKTEKKKINTYYQYLDYIKADDISDIRLSYVPVQYNDEFVYMPMWCFSYDATSTTIYTGLDFTGAFAVGALDGQVYLYDWAQVEG